MWARLERSSFNLSLAASLNSLQPLEPAAAPTGSPCWLGRRLAWVLALPFFCGIHVYAERGRAGCRPHKWQKGSAGGMPCPGCCSRLRLASPAPPKARNNWALAIWRRVHTLACAGTEVVSCTLRLTATAARGLMPFSKWPLPHTRGWT